MQSDRQEPKKPRVENGPVILSVVAVAVAIAAAFISYLQHDAQITLGRKAQEATDKQMALAEQSARDSARETQEALALTRRSVEAQRILADEYAKTAIFTES